MNIYCRMLTVCDLHNRYISTYFVNKPSYENTINIVLDKYYTQEIPYFSITIPVYNQENIIANNLQSIVQATTEKTFEIIIICDACSDNSEKRILNWFSSLHFTTLPLLTRILILRSTLPLFETSADNLGFFCSRGRYFLEIQADMNITDNGYNMKLLQPFLLDNTILGISGRCCHTFSQSLGYGKLGTNIEKTIQELGIDAKYYYISNTCNRGPLLLDGEKLRTLGYLDEKNYFLDDSDHDLFARAYIQKGWICGYVPIDVKAPLKHGSTRKQRDEINRNAYILRKQQTHDGIHGFLHSHKHILIDKEVQRIPLYT